jgi:hypothetical protein
LIHLAAAAASATDPLSLLTNYGSVGVMLLLVAAGFLVPKPTHQAVLKELDDLKAENKALNAALAARTNDLVPRTDLEVARSEVAKIHTRLEEEIFPGIFRTTATLQKAMETMGRLAERAPV